VYLVDTNILSELVRPRPNRGVVDWVAGQTEVSFSVISLEELWFGLALKPNSRLQLWFRSFIDRFCQVLPVTHEVATRCGLLRGQLRKLGIQRTQADMLIAATAQAHGLTVVTRNERDFEGCGVPVLNPFSS
jgi:predicted nucleic acid-binding protein